MEPRTDSAPAFHLYSYLPCELRLCIIEQFLLDRKRQRFVTPTRYMAEYATVDRQWKYQVEKLTFQSLRLRVVHTGNPDSNDNTNDLDAFEQTCVGDRISFLSRIRLTISLEVVLTTRPGTTTNDDGTHPSTLHAGQKATEVFCRLFRVLQTWSRDGRLLGITYRLDRRWPERGSRSLDGWGCDTRLRIDSSNFPEVPCVGSLRAIHGGGWAIEPVSVCHLLAKLPNATHADIDLHARLEVPNMVEMLEEGKSTLSLQVPKLKHLTMSCDSGWCKRLSLGPSSSSLEFNQSIYAMTPRLEELRLKDVVNVPSFLRDSCGANGSTPQSPPAWPNLKKLFVRGYTGKGAPNSGAVKEELHDSVTQALPQMPNLTDLVAMEFSEYHGCYMMIWMQVPRWCDRSALPDARMCWKPPESEPDRKTVDTWREIVRGQWHCGLVSEPHGCRNHVHWGIVASTSSHHDPLC